MRFIQNYKFPQKSKDDNPSGTREQLYGKG